MFLSVLHHAQLVAHENDAGSIPAVQVKPDAASFIQQFFRVSEAFPVVLIIRHLVSAARFHAGHFMDDQG